MVNKDERCERVKSVLAISIAWWYLWVKLSCCAIGFLVADKLQFISIYIYIYIYIYNSNGFCHHSISGFLAHKIILMCRMHQLQSTYIKYDWLQTFFSSFSFPQGIFSKGNFIIFSLRVFSISFSWLLFTGVWVKTNLLKSPGFFSVFSPFLIKL